MKLTGQQIKMMYEYVQENGLYAEYTVGNVIPVGNVGYKQYISTRGASKKNIADYDII